jgi:DNA-binding NtrC family response regulator
MDKTRKILVIDDDPSIREMLTEVLNDAGYSVDTASDGVEALRMIKSSTPELIVTDIIMPEQDGVGVMLQLSKEHPDIKIIAISGGGRISPESYLYMAEKFGAVKTFTKPFDINDFVDAVKTLLK